jgi:hypothetical protein
MYVNSKTFNPTFELQTTTIANSKPHGLFDSSTFGYDGITFYSLIIGFDEITFCFLTSKSPPTFFSPLPLAIINRKHLKNHQIIINYQF